MGTKKKYIKLVPILLLLVLTVGFSIEFVFHPMRGFQFLLYILIACLVALAYAIPGYCLVSRCFKFENIITKICLGCGTMAAIYAILYLAATQFFYSHRWLFAFVSFLLFAVASIRELTVSGKKYRQDLVSFARKEGFVPILAFFLALSVPHLDRITRFDTLGLFSSSTRAANYQPDSCIPYHIVQVLSNGLSRDEHNLFASWPVRPPLLGLNSGFFVTLFNLSVPLDQGRAEFEFFDSENYWVHRVVGTFLNSLFLLTPVLLSRVLGVSNEIALAAQVFLSLGVFTITNIYFVWAKCLAAFLLFLSLYLIRVEKRVIWSALMLSLSYQSHSFTVLYVPGFILFLLLEKTKVSWIRLLISFILFSSPWLVFCHFYNRQDVFYSYPFIKHEYNTFLWFRVQSFFNTLFPFGFSYYPYKSAFPGGAYPDGFDYIPGVNYTIRCITIRLLGL